VSEEVGCAVALGVVALGAAFGWFALQDAQMHGEWLLGRDCPFGAELAGAHPPNGTTEWCQRKDQTGSYVKYGVFRVWRDDGRIMDHGYFDENGTPHR
jgi:hypothetical protein